MEGEQPGDEGDLESGYGSAADKNEPEDSDAVGGRIAEPSAAPGHDQATDRTPRSGLVRVGLERVTPPEWRPGLVSRQRLLGALERGVRLSKVTGVVAPGGYGKSVLLADFVRKSEYECIWLRLDDSDRDPAQLLRSLAAAIDHRLQPSGLRTEVPGPADLGFVSGPVTELVVANRLLHPALDRVLVLDDFHTISESRTAVDTVAEVMDRAGDHVRLIVASRTGLPAALNSGALLNESSTPVGSAAMRFDRTDMDKLFEALDLPVPSWPSLHEGLSGCEGWPYAVMMALRGSQFATSGQLRRGAEPYMLFNLLADQIVQQLEPNDRKFLFEIASLERITPDLCSACLATDQPRERLQRLARVTPFLECRTSSDDYRLHALVRKFLMDHSDEARDFTESQHRLAAEWFGANGDDVAQIRHLIHAGDLVAAQVQIEAVADELEGAARWHTLLDVIHRLEESGAALSTVMVCSKARAQAVVGDAHGAVETVSASISTAGADPKNLVRLLLSRSYAYRARGEHDLAVADVHEALRHSDILTPGQRIKALRALASWHVSNLDVRESQARLAEARHLADQHDVARQRVLVRSDQATIDCIRGDVASAVACARESDSLALDMGYVVGHLFALNNLAVAQHLAGAYSDAFAALEQSLAIARRHGHLHIEAFSWLGHGDLYTDLGQYQTALSSYTRGLSLARAIGESEIEGHALRAVSSMHRLQGALGASRKAMSDLLSLGYVDKLSRAQGSIVHGALCTAEEKYPQAISILTDAVVMLDGTEALVDSAKARLLLAEAIFFDTGISGAAPHLEACASIVEQAQTNSFLVPLSTRMPRLWGVAEGEGLAWVRKTLSEPDLRPRVGPDVRGLPRTARVDDPHPDLLTPREREIVMALCEGLTRDEVASRIGRSRSTVDKAISMVYASTGFTSAHQLVAWAVRCGMYPPGGRNTEH